MSPARNPKFIVHFPPNRPTITQPSVVLYGAIESSPTDNWAISLTNSLSDLAVTVLNPRCDAWDSTWREDINFAPFKEQVDWEIDQAAAVDVIVFYFKPGALCPITLLELGMHGALYPKKCIVCCPEGFYKRGNVEIVCKRLGIPFLVENLSDLEEVVKDRMIQLLANVEIGEVKSQ
ncbi:hypothetical protein DM02DRAFT_553651 [Periconia macrospinosa]|uniref:Nucleoside 2-deoxyribosyltransferase domain-containing protein n=1 Tax=Periconia macrospinosa TaxID=97972 RepID=A0A2V1E9A2_9PLEO|nr:hypothetical protein DM02DRAFT_553651 [Periconia macrospinosa]